MTKSFHFKKNVKSPSLGGILQVQLKNLIKYTFVAFYLKTPIHFLNLKLFVAIRRSLNIVAQREKNNFLFNYDAFIFVCVDECVVI
jgi:hypothetical protein